MSTGWSRHLFRVDASIWDWVRFRWHGVRYRMRTDGDDDDNLVVQCSCGGACSIRRNGDGTSTVMDATCPRWELLARLLRLPLPKARVVR